MAFDFSKLATMTHGTFVVEVTARQKRLLDGITYGYANRAERNEARALWDRIKLEWAKARELARLDGVLLSSYELKVKLWPVPILYGQDNGTPIVIHEMIDDEGTPDHETDPGEKYNTHAAIVEAMNERAEFMLWKRRKELLEAFGPDVPGQWRGKPNKYAVTK